ncbi:hypothetical protein AB0425_32325 [Actinosynnema sp. NPDC051121]
MRRILRFAARGAALLGVIWLASTIGTAWLSNESHPYRPVVEALSWVSGILGLVVALVAIRQASGKRPGDTEVGITDDLILDLLERVLQRERVALAGMLGQQAPVRPASLRVRQPDLLYWRTDGGRGSESSEKIAAYYRSLDRGRLVLLGNPGGGKTVIAAMLTADLVEAALKDVSTAVIPLRMDLLTFNMAGYPFESSAECGSAKLQDWLRTSVATTWRLDRRLVDRLFDTGRILPVLDGLDELDGNADPIRARELVRALNHPVRGRLMPVVLVSREHTYQTLVKRTDAEQEAAVNELLAAIGESPHKVVGPTPLEVATVVHLLPLELKNVRAYLTRRFPSPNDPKRAEQRWKHLLDALAAPSGKLLRQVLAVPLNLFLIATAFGPPNTEPGQLLRFQTAESLRDELFRLFMSVGIERTVPERRKRSWTPDTVLRWLGALAGTMLADRYSPDQVEIRAYAVWRLAGVDLTRFLTAGVAIGISFVVTVASFQANFWLVVVVGGLVQMTAVSRLAAFTDVAPFRFRASHILTIPPLRLVPAVLLAGFGLYLRLSDDEILVKSSTVFLLSAFLAVFLAGEHSMIENHAGWLRGDDDTLELNWFKPIYSSDPVRYIRAGITSTAAVLVLGGTMILLARSSSLMLLGYSAGALTLSVSPWPHYWMGCLLFRFSKRFASRPAYFLRWAQEAGFLTTNGEYLRFRHREFQEWLAKQR